jgi:hypothetical protein
MRKLLSGFTLLLACLAVYAQAAMDEGASSVPSETEGVVWILLAVFAFFVMIGYFTWRLIKSEQKRQLESKKPD